MKVKVLFWLVQSCFTEFIRHVTTSVSCSHRGTGSQLEENWSDMRMLLSGSLMNKTVGVSRSSDLSGTILQCPLRSSSQVLPVFNRLVESLEAS